MAEPVPQFAEGLFACVGAERAAARLGDSGAAVPWAPWASSASSAPCRGGAGVATGCSANHANERALLTVSEL